MSDEKESEKSMPRKAKEKGRTTSGDELVSKKTRKKKTKHGAHGNQMIQTETLKTRARTGGRTVQDLEEVAVCLVEGEVGQISTSRDSPGGGKVEVNFDTRAAVRVIPLKYGSGTEVGTETTFRTASGDAIQDACPCVLAGKLRNGTKAELRRQLAPVHRNRSLQEPARCAGPKWRNPH